jgi:hypothetical protein
MLEIFTKKKSLAERRKALRAKIKHIEENTKWPNKRKAAKVSRYRRDLEELGRLLYARIPLTGLDVTGYTIVNDDGERINVHNLGGYVLGGPDSNESFLKAELATRPVYRNGVRFLEPIPSGEELDPGDYEEIDD